jgi:hypothetical protein
MKKFIIVLISSMALMWSTAPKSHAGPVAPMPVSDSERVELATQEAKTIEELAAIEGGDATTLIGLLLVAGAVVALAIVVSND